MKAVVGLAVLMAATGCLSATGAHRDGGDVPTDGMATGADGGGEDLVAGADLATGADLAAPFDLAAPLDLATPDLRVCTPEVCNGVDDDCDGVADNGCPTGVMMTGTVTAGGPYGNLGGGAAFDDSCPLGHVLIGMDGAKLRDLDRVTGHCGQLNLVESRAAIPFQYSITVTPSVKLPTHGINYNTPYSIDCPANTVIVAASGTAGTNGVASVHYTCAALIVSGSPGNFGLSYGGSTTIAVDATDVLTPYSFGAGGGAFDRLFGRSASWMDAIGFGARMPALFVR